MANKTVERKVTFSERDLPGFLDMLRYDQCTVVTWDRTEAVSERRGDTFEVTLQSMPGRTTGYEFTGDRWASFGLYLKDKEGNPAR